MEIVKGFHKVQREEQLQYFLSTLSQVEVIALDFKSSEISGRIYADLERTGQPIGRADPMIAGIAINHNLVDRKSTRLNSSHKPISYAVFCLKKKLLLFHHLLSPFIFLY